jgi:hypothetical protein
MDFDFEEFEVEIVTDKKKADFLYSLLVNNELPALELPPVPISAIKDFIEDTRANIWEVTINGEVHLTVTANKEAAMTLLKMVQAAGAEEFPLAPLPAENLRNFVNGQRANVGRLEIRRNKNVQVRVKSSDKKEKKEKDETKELKEV